MKYAVVTFYTTAGAMALEAQCRKRQIEGRLFSLPRSLSADCGIAWRSPAALLPALEALRGERELEIEGIYEMERQEG